MKALHVLVVGLAVMALATGDGVKAREWSDEVRMTYAEENHMMTNELSMEIDSYDDIHVLYSYGNYLNEEYSGFQPVYQKFNNQGEPLTDPIIIGEIAGTPDSIHTRGYSICIDNNDYVYLLWGANLYRDQQNAHVTVLNRNGEVLSEDIVLRGVTATNIDVGPEIEVDSNGNIIYAGQLNDRQEDNTIVFYARYTPEGDMIDTVHTVGGYHWARDFFLEIDDWDQLHIVWKIHAVNQHYSVHYSKVTPDDELVVNDFILPSIIGREDELHINGFTLDNSYSPLFLFRDVNNNTPRLYVVRLNVENEYDFITYIGLHYSGRGFLYVDNEEQINIVAPFDDEELDHGLRFIGYLKLNENGEIIDSIQVVHDPSMRGDERRPAYWSYRLFVFASNDGTVSAIWPDRRHGSGDTGDELYMRYSDQESIVTERLTLSTKISEFQIGVNYPNPFNNTTYIPFHLSNGFTGSMNIYDNQGRVVFCKDLSIAGRDFNIFQWNGTDWRGNRLPSGCYLLELGNGFERVARTLVITR